MKAFFQVQVSTMRYADEKSKAAAPAILEPEEARAGTKTGRVLWVLVSSLILAVIVMIVLLYRYWSPVT